MNEIQRSQITELRKQGYGYIRIAHELELSENTVKSYCRRNGLSADNLQNKVLCQNCGKLFINRKRQKPRKFCSDICRTTWWKTHPEQVKQKAVYSFICAGCEKPFTAYGNSNRKYCCHKCYINARFGEKCGNDE